MISNRQRIKENKQPAKIKKMQYYQSWDKKIREYEKDQLLIEASKLNKPKGDKKKK